MIDFNPDLDILPEKLYQKLLNNEEFTLIDCRNPKSFNDWHIMSSKNIPFKKALEISTLKIKDPNKPIFTVCSRGNDSRLVAKHFQNLGVPVLSINGGLKKWNTVIDVYKLPLNDKKWSLFQFRRIGKGCLSYILESNNEIAIFDPINNKEFIKSFIEKNNYSVRYIFETHLHADHVSIGRHLSSEYEADYYLSDRDPFTFEFNKIRYNKSLDLGGEKLILPIETPGHTKGSTSYKIGNYLLVGDTVFADGIGRPDLAHKAEEYASDLYHTIHNKILQDKDLTIVPSHHGKFEKHHFNNPIATNPRKISEYEAINLSEPEFIKYAVEKTLKTAKPDSYSKIININSGRENMLTNNQILELELGPNRCAFS